MKKVLIIVLVLLVICCCAACIIATLIGISSGGIKLNTFIGNEQQTESNPISDEELEQAENIETFSGVGFKVDYDKTVWTVTDDREANRTDFILQQFDAEEGDAKNSVSMGGYINDGSLTDIEMGVNAVVSEYRRTLQSFSLLERTNLEVDGVEAIKITYTFTLNDLELKRSEYYVLNEDMVMYIYITALAPQFDDFNSTAEDLVDNVFII